MMVHTFNSTGEAYNASQVRDDIKDGDILSVPTEGVVGFLLAAWPVAIVTDLRGPGEFHQIVSGPMADDHRNEYRQSIKRCIDVSETLLFFTELAGGPANDSSIFWPADATEAEKDAASNRWWLG